MRIDEMDRVRAFRDEAPDADRARLAVARRALLDGMDAGRRRKRMRANWRLAAVGVAAVLTAAATVGPHLLNDDGAALPAAPPPAYVLDLGSAKPVLREAADAVADDPVPQPHAGQWAYSKVYEIRSQADGPDEEKGGPRVAESWLRYDDPKFENGHAGDDHSPREMFRFLAALPGSDPAEVKQRAKNFYAGGSAEGETSTQHVYRALRVLVSRANPAHPKGLAAAYRALATVPGVRAVRTIDALGRDSIGITLPDKRTPDQRVMVFFDPKTYRYSGEGLLKRYGDHWKSVSEPGRVSALLASGLVDKKGDRPAS
ncbi:CU044_5270 family protein [Streptomyces kunmingensis]|uniref:CU044_5270 family protein n=1 Tax=Streptomyces kunmingensis TaxID=68225 RepID=A0ABU6C2F9_9ACTN|nr:CU044_5270 family protein [Streptomyces kunmingensis]MEB3958714.1 CU044_5270 family protein [Streptomyces kunmingensis]